MFRGRGRGWGVVAVNPEGVGVGGVACAGGWYEYGCCTYWT